MLLYLIFSVSNSMFVSNEDKRAWWFIPILLIFVIAFVYGFRIQFNTEKLIAEIVKNLQPINRALFLCLGLDLFFLILLNFVRNLAEIFTGKRILSKMV